VNRIAFAFFSVLALVAPARVLAQPTLINTLGGARGYGTDCLSTNDDGSSDLIDLTAAFPGGLEFFGIRHTTGYVNTNGNITFAGPLATFTPTAFPVAEQPMIAPYWADVDIRGAACSGFGGDRGCASPTTNGVWWHLEPGRMVVTWDRVGFFMCDDSRQMTFQLILNEARYCGIAGDFDVEFRYTQCEWETGDASDGVGGFGGTPAQVGFDAGNLADFVSIMGSRMDGISRVVCDGSNVGEPGVWRFRIRRGVIECPDAGDPCTIAGAVGVCAEGRTRCARAGVECQPIVAAGPEVCDAFDNDCDGEVDEDPRLCGDSEICVSGRCIGRCFEGGCAEGFTCTPEGVCTEDACATVTCPAGERCVGGACVGVCGGIVCPPGQSCVGGSCQNLCTSVECGACEFCSEGTCRTRCEVDGCAVGEACEETGECVEEACLGVRCGPGRVCRAGVCANACDGVVCPAGQRCTRGECVVPPPVTTPDAGMPGVDAGGMTGTDMGGMAEVDAGRITAPPAAKDGCSCSVPGAATGGRDMGGALLAVAMFGLALGRRRSGVRVAAARVAGAASVALLVSWGLAGCTSRGERMTGDAVCGDGAISGLELCDDSGTAPGDGCSIFCTVESGWSCTGEPSVCTNGGPLCGDMRVDTGEMCDDGGESAECDADCTAVICGDRRVNALANEACDDGNAIDGDGCTAGCLAEPGTCGNAMCEAGETCSNCAADCAATPLCSMCDDFDLDGATDQACGGTDCNDEDPMVRPGMPEIPCNRIDEDCDRATRDALDADMDGSTCNFDCDDADPDRSPLTRELCGDMVDNDCNPETPDVFDTDRDGASCEVDCDDFRATTCPTCPEICNNTINDDCNPATPDAFDADGDGSSCDLDCNDGNAMIRPGGTELCDGVDNDCDALLDGPGEDDDRDGFADLSCGMACVGSCGDCDDANARVSPAEREFCGNMRDDDCNPATSDALVDGDLDGATCDLDCNDADATLFPDASGLCGTRFEYFEDFEAGAGGWTTSGAASSWAWGRPAGTFIPRAASGMNAWVTSLTGDYRNDELSYLTSPPIDLSTVTGAVRVAFSHIYETETFPDGGWLEVSVDGGTTWRKVGAVGEGANWYSNASRQWWSGTSGAAGVWRTASISLTGVAGRADVRLRFVLDTDGSFTYEGFGVDDVRVTDQLVDLAVSALDATPPVACSGANLPIRVTIRNDGTTNVGAFSVAYTVDGGTPVSEMVRRTLRPGETYLHTFATPLALTAGARTVVGSVSLMGDASPVNDTARTTFTVTASTVLTAVPAYSEGFESTAGGWTASGMASSWARGLPTSSFVGVAGEGTRAWATSLASTYNNNELSYLQSPCFDFGAVMADPDLSFLHIYRTRPTGDSGWMEVTTDGIDWVKLGTAASGTNWYSDATENVWRGDTGMADVWRTASHPLVGTAGRPLVRFRFVFSSNATLTEDGFGVDAFSIAPPPAPPMP
jgi:MYXO-CTERM domain-containing protein